MRIVLDLQACQSPEGRRRGIGRYSLALAKAIAAKPRGHEIIVLLNAAMGESVEYLRAQFDPLLSQDRILTWEALAPSAAMDPSNEFRKRVSEALRAHMLEQLKPDLVHVASLFDGWGDDVIATVPDVRPYVTAVTLYDLIPLSHSKTYLADPAARHWYMEKVENLGRADLLLGISRYTCLEAETLLGVASERIANISAAAEDSFSRLPDVEGCRRELMHRYGLQRSYVMYAGGFDARKNIGMLLRAYAALPVELRRTYQLAIVGGAPQPEREALVDLSRQLGLTADELVFTGFVPDADLVKLYHLCSLYVFPSLQEGFGLPALEAMSCGAVVIGSATSSLPEVIGFPDALFEPTDLEALTRKMVTGLTDEGFRRAFLEHAQRQCKEFSWGASADRALDAFELSLAQQGVRSLPETPRSTIRCDEAKTCAFLPAPQHQTRPSTGGEIAVYADGDLGTDDVRSLADFARDRALEKFGRILIELSDDPYCAKTLAKAADGAVDILLRDTRFGRALHALASLPEGRPLVVSLLYRSGGYPAVRTAGDSDFSAQALGQLVSPAGLLALGRTQVILPRELDGGVSPGPLAWRETLRRVIDQIAAAGRETDAAPRDWSLVAGALAANHPLPDAVPQLLIDISNLAVHDAGTGIQRVVRHVLDALMKAPPEGYRIEPVCLGDDGVLRYAREYCQRRYFSGELLPADEPVEWRQGDIFLGLDLAAHLIPQNIELFRRMRNRGVAQYFVVYDLLPLLRPDCFDPPGLPLFRSWYESIAEVCDGVICISRAVADEFQSWLDQARPERLRSLSIGWFHLGADLRPVDNQVQGDAACRDELASLGDRPTLLMVGTIEPRKGHAQALGACERLWQQGVDVNLLVIGKPGWLIEDVMQRMAEHPERGQRLFWFENAGDDLLLAAYRRADALLMASEGEGFGLPLIEGAHYGLPLIARDLPVFREIAGPHAHYFSGNEAEDLAGSLQAWLRLHAAGLAPTSDGMRWNTWAKATAELVDVILEGRWIHQWMPGAIRRYAAFDYRFHTEVGRLVRGRVEATGEEGVLLRGPGIRLEAGRYVVRVLGGGTGSGHVDIQASASTHPLARGLLLAAGGDPAVLAEIALQLHRDVDDLEVSILVAAGAGVWLTAVEIAPGGT